MTDDDEQDALRAAILAAEPNRQRVLALCKELGYGFVLQVAAVAWAQEERMGFRNMATWLRGLRDEIEVIGSVMEERRKKGFLGRWPDYMLQKGGG